MKPLFGLPLGTVVLAFTLVGCGQDPSFVDASLTETSRVSGVASDDAVVMEQGSPDGDSDAASVGIPGASENQGGMARNPIAGIVTTRPSTGGASSLPAGGSSVISQVPSISTPANPGVTNPIVTPAPSDSTPIVNVPSAPQPTPTPAPAPAAFPSEPSNPASPVFTVPGLTPSEQVQVSQCITKWGRVPFTGHFTNVKRIKAAVSVYGIGNMINDVTQTSTPALVLVDAGVNVMGNPVYNLLNNNGYYCMKVNVNVQTDFDINLACNAKLADNSVQVNVASEVDSETGVIGVNVGSTVHVTRMTPNRGTCSN
jgi:hypothetical protein